MICSIERIYKLIGAGLGSAPFLVSLAFADPIPEQARGADVIFLGEQHDNSGHHQVQAKWVAALDPRAIVFEMLTEKQAARITAQNRVDAKTLEDVLKWTESGWPDFEMYYPIFVAAPAAAVFGAAVRREQLQQVMKEDLVDVLDSEEAQKFGLDQPLPEEEGTRRLRLQQEAHCGALPEEFLPRMVAVQRLRDAVLAQSALAALDTYGAPVVVITGNGHARDDWGASFLVRQVASDLSVFTLGQGEAGQMPSGGFSAIVDGPAVDRGDPCDAFK